MMNQVAWDNGRANRRYLLGLGVGMGLVLLALALWLWPQPAARAQAPAVPQNASCQPPFNDISCDHWAREAIERIRAAGITVGCGDNNYCPLDPVTRAQMAVFLLRGRHGGGYGPPAATGGRFADVPAAYWAAAWIEDLAAAGITVGCGGDYYCPNASITRAQMAIFLLRAKHGSGYQPPPATGARFADVKATHWAAAWIEQLAQEGIAGGCGGGDYCPDAAVSRDQMARFLVRTFSLADGGEGTGPLNDTGIDWCANDTTNDLPCPVAGFPGQDGDHGRDALARAGQLPKVGGGAAGFDFTKISNSGAELPTTATLGGGPNDWACTRDNVTSLIWEVKMDDPSHPRHQGHTYTWYDPNSPDGDPGVANGGTCTGSACDTHAFVQAVNQQGLCGANDWRLPTVKDLEGIVDYGRIIPAIDTGYFPNTPSYYFWAASPYANRSDGSWSVNFDIGSAGYHRRSDGYHVRLVRGGP